jgi:hypothetical protein
MRRDLGLTQGGGLWFLKRGAGRPGPIATWRTSWARTSPPSATVADRELWLDANVARNPHKVRELANLARAKGVVVLVHAQVHLAHEDEGRDRA